MKDSFISLEKLPYNGLEWHVQINSSNSNFCGVQDFYTYPENLKVFGMDLCQFPQEIQDEVKFELGDRQETWSYYLLIRTFLFDSVGHAAIELFIDNNLNSPHGAQTNFFICTEVASINNFGKQLLEWIVAPANMFLWIPCVS